MGGVKVALVGNAAYAKSPRLSENGYKNIILEMTLILTLVPNVVGKANKFDQQQHQLKKAL